MFKNIHVATDGTDQADHALKFAIELAAKWDAQVIILSVIPPTPLIADPDGFSPTYLPDFENDLKEVYQSILDKAKNTVAKEQPEIEVEACLEKGRPSNVIVKVAEIENVDLIVMGSRGLGGITGMILGSTSQAVVHSCTRPVLIVK